MIGFIISALFEFGCVFYKKRPRRLLKEVVENGQTFDAVIVPGAPFKNNTWDSVMKGRVIWSYVLYKNGIVRNVIYSGGAVYSPYYEAKIMGLYAMQLGIPAEHIFYDTMAEHSTENIYYSYGLARNAGFKSIALATDPFQSSMLKAFTKKRFATPVVHLPFVIDSLRQYNYLSPEINPAPAFQKHFKSITERQGFWERLRGTRGKYIPFDKYPDGIVPAL
ncbi:YdcF family protein [Taibaiella lutea]|uniref:YdcF family protein n=2 Tax=Taibaiella lutea TaxID=2608001 RepID=A0A5M6CRD8_9BACT|nr:YdcF family protein [Taibaiella lutea]